MSYQTETDQYPFFFYGTLRHGQENYTILRYRTVYEQIARASSKILYSLKQYPIMAPGDGMVYGELMDLHPRFYRQLMTELDYLEGYDENNPVSCELQRCLIPVEVESGKIQLAWTYMVGQSIVERYPLRTALSHGDWVYYKKQLLKERQNGRYRQYIPDEPAGISWQANQETEQDRSMPQASIFQWRDGGGWLVLTGSDAFDSEPMNDILSTTLARVVSLGPVVYIWAAGDVDTADRHLGILGDMGSPTGYLVDIISEDNDTLKEQIEQAGLIVLGDGINQANLRSGLEGVVVQAMGQAYKEGATILGIGAGATVLGQWLLNDEAQLQPAFGWLKQALVVLDNQENETHEFLIQHPTAYGLGLSQGAGIAFSPEGAMEVLGNQQIRVTLGKELSKGN